MQPPTNLKEVQKFTGCLASLSRFISRLGVTSQGFIKFWGKFFAFVLLEMIEISQGFKTF
jgi:hypothetical protein